ncbi:MAG TPA: Xaa-Pro peptidase family protein, partial [Candidatus Dormibacteraeota bacterium]|nr:Xaa-Pro peptidase family protein [Candidatus Dormibacteraeota bacterium]
AVRADGATLIVPSLEEEKALATASDAEVVAWRDGEDPYALVAQVVAGSAEVAVEKDHLTLHAAEVMTSRTGVSELVDVAPEIRRLRLLKSAHEIETLARAAALTDEAFVKALARIRVGMTEIEVATVFAAVIADLGGTLSFPTLVQSGPNSAMPHLEPSGRKLSRGDFVLLDFGAAVDGYKGDSTRMAVMGEPSPRHREIHDVVLRGHDAAIAAVRPGATTGDVDAAARRVIEAAGYGQNFFHRVGHGLGLEGHEDPSLDPGSRTVLEPGMVFTVEPGVYVPGFGGVRIEDDVVVTEDGVRVLTRADRSLHVISG